MGRKRLNRTPEEVKTRKEKYYWSHRDEILEKISKWKMEHPDKQREYTNKKREKFSGVTYDPNYYLEKKAVYRAAQEKWLSKPENKEKTRGYMKDYYKKYLSSRRDELNEKAKERNRNLTPEQKAIKKQKAHEYYLKNKEKYIANTVQYMRDHPEKKRQYYKNEKDSGAIARRNELNKEKIIEYRKKYYAEHKDYFREKLKIFQAKKSVDKLREKLEKVENILKNSQQN